MVFGQGVVHINMKEKVSGEKKKKKSLKAHRRLCVEASVFELRVSGATRFCCSNQCAVFLPLGSSFESLSP